jgi:hypothetical protein
MIHNKKKTSEKHHKQIAELTEYVWQDSSYKTMNVILFHARRDRYTDFFTLERLSYIFDYKESEYGYGNGWISIQNGSRSSKHIENLN